MIRKIKSPLKIENDTYDQEWIKLIREAKQSGLTVAEIRTFLQKSNSYPSIPSSHLHSKLQHF